MRNMGYGYYEPLRIDFTDDPAWHLLAGDLQKLASIDLALFTFELEALIEEAQSMVNEVFSTPAVAA